MIHGGVARGTRSLTLIGCLKRLQGSDASEVVGAHDTLCPIDVTRAEPRNVPAEVPLDGTLTIHLVGADHREGNSAQETVAIFEQFFQYLTVEDQRYRTLQLVLIGPNVAHKLHNTSHECIHIDKLTQRSTSPSIQVAIAYYVGSFDDYYMDPERYLRPDLAVCFNAGIWGYDQWLPTIRLLVNTIKTSLLVTSYNANEAADDEDVLDDSVAPVRWLWRAEKNPFGSSRHRSTRNDIGSILKENDYWMCIGPAKVQTPALVVAESS